MFPMPVSRKAFLRQTAFAAAGTLFPYSKLFANVFTPPPRNLQEIITTPVFAR